MNSKHYDLIVIGSGPAGEKGAARAAYFNKKVALIEKADVLGGMMTQGGVLTKTLRETVLNITGLRQRGLYGVDINYQDSNLDIATFMYRERQVRSERQNTVSENLEHHKVDSYAGFASFVDEHTINVASDAGEVMLSGDVFLIATGSHPVHIPIFPYDNPYVYDSDSILSMKKMPKHLVVVGAGVVGCEFACVFGALGIPVTLIDSKEQLLSFADHEISALLQTNLQNIGVTLISKEYVDEVVPIADGQGVTVSLKSGRQLVTDALLASVGRASNVEGLDLEAAGVETGARGLIKVNKHYQTNVPHIYAAGDVIGFPALSSTAMEQARAAMGHAFNLIYDTTDFQTLPLGIWTIPEISMVGETERSLQEKGIPYVVGKVPYTSNPRGIVLGQEGLLKLIFSVTDRTLLGVHIIGQEACELIGMGLLGITTKATVMDFITTCFNFPSLTDMYKYASYSALGEFDALEQTNTNAGE